MIKGTRDVVKYAEITLRTLSVEHFVVLFLNKGNAIIDHVDIRGSHDNVQVDYRFIIKRAIVFEATSIICAHNHPLNISLLDHIIIPTDLYYSF